MTKSRKNAPKTKGTEKSKLPTAPKEVRAQEVAAKQAPAKATEVTAAAKEQELTTPQKEKFLHDFFTQEANLDEEMAAHLAKRVAETFATLTLKSTAEIPPPLPKIMPPPQASPAPPSNKAPTPTTPEDPAAGPSPTSGAASAPFDPFGFGLVPVFLKEGREVLVAKLLNLADVDRVRAMARAQKIILDAKTKTGPLPLKVLVEAVVTVVERRVSDRRAAAG